MSSVLFMRCSTKPRILSESGYVKVNKFNVLVCLLHLEALCMHLIVKSGSVTVVVLNSSSTLSLRLTFKMRSVSVFPGIT